MKVAIVVGTHGDLARQLLRTAEMLVGKQDNIACVDFLPGENVQILAEKYNSCAISLDRRRGMIFLVDMWGGSPFNAASRLARMKIDHEIITGVNVPMVVEMLMLRDDGSTLDELVQAAVEIGRASIRTFRSGSTQPAIGKAVDDCSDQVRSTSARGMDIRLIRIDDRLIHGQVVTSWVRNTGVTCIIVVNDEIAEDDVRKALITQVSPPGVSSHVVDVEKLARVYDNPKYSGRPVMLLFTNPSDVLRAVEMGLPIDSVNVGGMAYLRGKRKLNDVISLDEDDIRALRKLAALKVRLEVRKVYGEPAADMMQLMEKAGLC